MFIVHTPEDGEEQRYSYDPRRLMSPEMEVLERVTDRSFSTFVADVAEGNALCRRALLWVLQKRRHPTLKFADVSFVWGELALEFSTQEYDRMIQQVTDTMTGSELAVVLAKLNQEREESTVDPETLGKAQLPTVD